MVTPLHIEIALHYHCRSSQHPMMHNEVHVKYAEDLVEAGLLRRCDNRLGEYERTDGLTVWVQAICSTPYPVRGWVIPVSWNKPAGHQAPGAPNA